MRSSRLPLRTSLLLGILALTFAALAVAAAVSAVAMRAYLLDRTDTRLRGAANLVLARGPQLMTDGSTLRSVLAPTDYLVEVRVPAGDITRLSGTSALPARPLLDQLPSTAAGLSTVDNRYRVVVVDLGGATVLIGLPLAPVGDAVRRLVVIEAVTALAVLVILAVLARVLVVRRLRPLEAVTAAAGLSDDLQPLFYVQYLLSLLAQSIIYTSYSNIGPEGQRWYFALGVETAKAFVSFVQV